MKYKLVSVFKINAAITLVACLLVFLSSCETKIDFQTSPVVPAAKGYVTVKKDDNKNYRVYVKVSNLAASTRLLPPKATYVVWISDSKGNAQNIGQIQASDRNSYLETVSSFKPGKLFITAEDTGHPLYPGMVILTTGYF